MKPSSFSFISTACVISQCRVGLGVLTLSLKPSLQVFAEPVLAAALSLVLRECPPWLSVTESGAEFFPGALTWNFNHVLVAKWEVPSLRESRTQDLTILAASAKTRLKPALK